MGMRNSLEKISPSLRPFLRGSKTVAVAGIKCLTNLVSNEKSPSSTSLLDEFNHIVERDHCTKSIALYHERRFTKLGYTSLVLLDALSILQKVVNETSHNNLHVQASQMYLDSQTFFFDRTICPG